MYIRNFKYVNLPIYIVQLQVFQVTHNIHQMRNSITQHRNQFKLVENLKVKIL